MNNLDRYYALMNTSPHYFTNKNAALTIITERERIEAYMASTKTILGVIYESNYRIFLVDLVQDHDGRLFPYERIIQKDGGVVIIPLWKDNYILLKQYRHAIRNIQFAFPRGFGEIAFTPIENAKKELSEELGSNAITMKELGTIYADSGLCSNLVYVFVAEIEEYQTLHNYEGIQDTLIVSKSELKEMIASHQINDAYTLSALSLLWN